MRVVLYQIKIDWIVINFTTLHNNRGVQPFWSFWRSQKFRSGTVKLENQLFNSKQYTPVYEYRNPILNV